MVGLDQYTLDSLPYFHRRMSGQQLHHHAFVGWIKVLDENERQAVAVKQRCE